MTWCNRRARVRIGGVVKVVRISNSYRFLDPGSKSEFQSGTTSQDISSSVKPTEIQPIDPEGLLERAIALGKRSRGRGCAQYTGRGLTTEETMLRDPRLGSPQQIEPLADEAPVAAPRPPRRGVTLLQLTSRTCRWPIGDPKKEDFCFCGATTPVWGRPYCELHLGVAYHAPAQPGPGTWRR
jgi:hypothetical protein